jgi:hypothetical protein
LLGLHTTNVKVSGSLNLLQTFKDMTDEELEDFINKNKNG